MSWDFDFDDDSFLSDPFNQADQGFPSQFDNTFFSQEQQTYVEPTFQQQPIFAPPLQQIPQQVPQQVLPPQMMMVNQVPISQFNENQNLVEENNQLRQFFFSLKQKAEQVENQNQKLKGQLNECRNWFRNAMFSGIQSGSNKQ